MKNLYLIICFLLLSCGLSAQNCTAGEATVIISITTDSYGQETSWILKDNNTNVIYATSSNPSYPNGVIATYHDTICIPQNACVTFTINDVHNDGMCCTYGDGGYQVTIDGSLVAEGGEFTSQEATSFNCLPGLSCDTAIPVSEGNHTTQGADYWYEFKPSQVGIYNISTCNLNTCNTKIWIYDNCTVTPAENNTGTIFYNDNNPECNAAAFLEIPFDIDLTYYVRIGDSNGSCEGNNIDWTLTYIGEVSGCMDSEACNYNPLATVSDTCFYEGNLANCPGPDLVLDENKLNFTLIMDDYDEPEDEVCLVNEGCLNGYGARDLIRFTTHIKNIGETDYFIGTTASDTTGQFTYDNCHNHYHYDGYAEYLLYDENGTETPIGFKAGFCVLDLECNGGGTTKYNCTNMGISTGCGDIYDAQLDCQWIDITNTPDGEYTLVTRVNWDNDPDALGRYETNFSNNWAQACINIYTDANGERQFEKISPCDPFVDCAGEVYGSAQPDCAGVCNGSTLSGDLNADGVQEMQDVSDYVTKILGDDISPTTCNDLNADSHITVYDAALLASCLNFGSSHNHPQTGLHDHCQFPDGLLNPYDTVALSIGDINHTEQYIDIDITNPHNAVVAYQFSMSGIEIMSVENLASSDITPQAVPGGDMVIGISYDDLAITKNLDPIPLCRIRYMNITDDEICIASITDIVNQDYEQTNTKIDGDCGLVSVSNPLTHIKATISPNPIEDIATLSIPNTSSEAFTLKITDVTGKVIQVHEDIHNTTYTFQRGSLQSGVYLYQLESEKKIATGKLVVK